jgi:hypothetical protein
MDDRQKEFTALKNEINQRILEKDNTDLIIAGLKQELTVARESCG